MPFERRKVDTQNTAFWAWWVVAGLMTVIILYRIANFIYRRSLLARREKILAARHEAHAHAKFRMRHVGPSMIAIVKRIFSVQTLPVYLYRSPSIGELVWTWGYVGVILGFTLKLAKDFGPFYYSAFGYMVFAQLPLIIGLAGKNNVISYLTRVSYERFHFMHRTVGRMAILFAWIHFLGHARQGAIAYFGAHSRLIASGCVALSAMTLIELTSERPVRKGLYEIFLIFHLFSVAMMIVGTWLHQPKLNFWIYAGLIIWSFDRVVSLSRFLIINSSSWGKDKATIELLNNDVLRVTVRNKRISWSAGQHAYVSAPSLGKHPIERHPFSIMNIPQKHTSKQEMVFLIRSQTGFTKRVKDGLKSTMENATVLVEGPYGVAPPLRTYDTVILVAGGVGVTHAMALFLEVLQDMRDKKTLTRMLRMVWATKHAGDVDWILPTLNEAFKEGTPENVRVELDIHLSQASIAEDPHEDEVPDDMDDMDMPSTGASAEEGAAPVTQEKHLSRQRTRQGVRATLRRGLSAAMPSLESPSIRASLNDMEKRQLAAHPHVPMPTVGEEHANHEGHAGHAHFDLRPTASRRTTHGLRPVASRQISGFTQIRVGHTAAPPEGISEEEATPAHTATPAPAGRASDVSGGTSGDTTVQGSPSSMPSGLPSAAPATAQAPKGALVEMPDSMSPFVKVHSVRASLDDLLMHDLNHTQGPVHVSVCGPSSLADEVRKVVRHTISPVAIMKGEQQSIDLRIEQFGW